MHQTINSDSCPVFSGNNDITYYENLEHCNLVDEKVTILSNYEDE